MRIQQMGPNSVSTGITQFCLAKLLLDTNRPDSALAMYQKVLPVFEEKLSSNHSFTIRTPMGMGSAHLALDNFERGRELLENGFMAIQKIHDPNSLERALAESQVAELWLRQGKFKQVDSLLTHSYNTLRRIEGKSSPRQKQVTALLNRVDTKKPVTDQ